MTSQNLRKVITNIETGQDSRKVITNIEMGQNSEKWSRRSRWVNRTQTEDRYQDMREFVQNELTDHILQQEVLKEFVMNLLMVSQIRARKTERIRDELVDGSKIGAREHKRIHGEVPDETKVDDDVTDQSVNQSRATENDSKRDIYQVRIQEKVETIWLFDAGADAHVMPKHVWEKLGEPTLQTTRVTLNHTTKWQRKGNDATRRKQRHSQNCVHAEAKRCTDHARANWTCHI